MFPSPMPTGEGRPPAGGVRAAAEDDPPTVAAAFPDEDEPGTVPAAFPDFLSVTAPDGAVSRFALAQTPVTIGRSRRAGNDLALDGDEQVSKVHARLERETDGGWTVYDLHSTNGVSVNGARIAGNRALSDGDTVTIGATTLVLHTGEAASPARASGLSDAGPERPRRARLVTTDGQEHVLASETLLGRAVTSDMVLPDPAVSTRHARIVAPDWNTYYLEDVGSAEGTWLNGRRLLPHSRALLADGDTVRVGQTTLRFAGGAR